MLNIYQLSHGKLEKVLDIQEVDEKKMVWVDLIAPTPSECAYVSQKFKQPISSISEMSNIESSARFYENSSGLHLLSFFPSAIRSARIINTTVSLTLHNHCLFSLRDRELSSFRLYCMRCKKYPRFTGNHPYEFLLGILETKTEQLADEIEFIYNELEHLQPISLERNEKKFRKTLLQLAQLENCSSKIRLCLIDSQRAFKFFLQKSSLNPIDPDHKKKTTDMLKNVESLIPHNEMLFQRVSFLTQTTIGLIQMEQNRIMEFISIITAVTLPCTLLNGWLGMDVVAFFGEEFVRWQYQIPGFFALLFVSWGFYKFLKHFKFV